MGETSPSMPNGSGIVPGVGDGSSYYGSGSLGVTVTWGDDIGGKKKMVITVLRTESAEVAKLLYCNPTTVTASTPQNVVSVLGTKRRGNVSSYFDDASSFFDGDDEEEPTGPPGSGGPTPQPGQLWCNRYRIFFGYERIHKRTYTYLQGTAGGEARGRTGADIVDGLVLGASLLLPGIPTIGGASSAGGRLVSAADNVADTANFVNVAADSEGGLGPFVANYLASLLGMPGDWDWAPGANEMQDPKPVWYLYSTTDLGSKVELPPGGNWRPKAVRCPSGATGSPEDCAAATKGEIPPSLTP